MLLAVTGQRKGKLMAKGFVTVSIDFAPSAVAARRMNEIAQELALMIPEWQSFEADALIDELTNITRRFVTTKGST